jgi:hypothetical protein
MTLEEVIRIRPQQKDKDRADGLQFRGKTFFGSGAPFESEAAKQAKLIKDPIKLVRRAKAVFARWGDYNHTGWSAGIPSDQNVWKPFEEALRNLGLNREMIQALKDNHKCD